MKSGLINANGTRTYAVVFDKDDEVISGLKDFARANGLDASSFTAIGGCSSVVFEFFNKERKAYDKLPLDEQVEVISLSGNIALDPDGQPKVHAHGVVGRCDASTRGGHIERAYAWPTLEVILEEAPTYLRRKVDPDTGLALIDIDYPE